MLPIEDIAGRTGSVPLIASIVLKTTHVGPISFNFLKTGSPLYYDMGDGSTYTSNFVLHNYVLAGEKTITIYADDPALITGSGANNSRNLTYVDLSMTTNMTGAFNYSTNNITTFISPTSTAGFSTFRMDNNPYAGVLDLTPFRISGLLYFYSMPNITNVNLNTDVSQVCTDFRGYNSGFTGTFDFKGVSVNGSNCWLFQCSNLTQISHKIAAGQSITSYACHQSNITGVLDLSQVEIKTFYSFYDNPSMTNILHKATTTIAMNRYFAWNTGLVNPDTSMIGAMGGSIRIYNCPDLETITFPASTPTATTSVWLQNNPELEEADLAGFANITGGVNLYSNASMTDVYFPPVQGTGSISIAAYDCDLMSTWDLSKVNLTGSQSMGDLFPGGIPGTNNVTTFIFNPSNGNGITFWNTQYLEKLIGLDFSVMPVGALNNLTTFSTFQHNNMLGGIQFPLSTCVLNSFAVYQTNLSNTPGGGVGIIDITQLPNMTDVNNHYSTLIYNSWTTAQVNEMLVLYDTISVGGYTGRTIQIDNNAAPDGSAGGFDGLTAKANLIAKGFNVLTA